MNIKNKLKELGIFQIEYANPYDISDKRIEIYSDLGLLDIKKRVLGLGKIEKVKSKSKHKIYLFIPN